jgi:hypothetical protein
MSRRATTKARSHRRRPDDEPRYEWRVRWRRQFHTHVGQKILQHESSARDLATFLAVTPAEPGVTEVVEVAIERREVGSWTEVEQVQTVHGWLL